MSESGHYPLGAEHDPNAPWNQHDPEPLDCEICISQTLSKTQTVTVTDYIEGGIEEEWETDEETGRSYRVGVRVPPDTTDTDWKSAYADQHETPLELIALLKKKCEGELELLEKLKPSMQTMKSIAYLKYLIAECSGWVDDETEVIPE